MEKTDDGLKALLESGKEKGYLTYDQVNDHLPDDDANPEKIDQILILLEEQGIELIEESEAEEREGGAAGPCSTTRRAPNSTSASWTRTTAAASTTRCGCTSPRWASIPLLKREQEIALAKKIEVTRKRFRRKVLECDGALQQVVETAQARPRRRPALRPHRQGVADGEPGKGQDPPADAAQPADARTPDGAEPGGLRQASSTRAPPRTTAAGCGASSASAAARP